MTSDFGKPIATNLSFCYIVSLLFISRHDGEGGSWRGRDERERERGGEEGRDVLGNMPRINSSQHRFVVRFFCLPLRSRARS